MENNIYTNFQSTGIWFEFRNWVTQSIVIRTGGFEPKNDSQSLCPREMLHAASHRANATDYCHIEHHTEQIIFPICCRPYLPFENCDCFAESSRAAFPPLLRDQFSNVDIPGRFGNCLELHCIHDQIELVSPPKPWHLIHKPKKARSTLLLVFSVWDRQ